MRARCCNPVVEQTTASLSLRSVHHGKTRAGRGIVSETMVTPRRHAAVDHRTVDLRPPAVRAASAVSGVGAAVPVVRRPQSADTPIPIRCGGCFPRTILSGLCTYGIGRKAIVDTFLDGDVSRVCPSGARFASVLFPARRWGPASGRKTTNCWRQHHHRPNRDDVYYSPRWNLFRPRNSLHRRTR